MLYVRDPITDLEIEVPEADDVFRSEPTQDVFKVIDVYRVKFQRVYVLLNLETGARCCALPKNLEQMTYIGKDA